MAKAITSLNIKNDDGTFSNIPLGIKAENIKLKNNKDLETAVVFLDENADTTEIAASKTPLYQEDVVDNLVSNSNIVPLSGKQGKILNERINQISNFDGTPSDLEIADLRVGADGRTYNSAGEAVRENINLANENINKKENLDKKVKRKAASGSGYMTAASSSFYPSVEYLEEYYYDQAAVQQLIEDAKSVLGTQESAELIDIRKGADGNLYEKAGDAVRFSIQRFNNDLNQKITLLNLNQVILFDANFNILTTIKVTTGELGTGLFATVVKNPEKVVYAVIPASISIIYGDISYGCENLKTIYIVNSKENLIIKDFTWTDLYFLGEMDLEADIMKTLPLLKIHSQLSQIDTEIGNKADISLSLSKSKNLFKLKDVSIEEKGLSITIKNNHIRIVGTPTAQYSNKIEWEEGLTTFEQGKSYVASCQNCINNSGRVTNFYLWGTYSSTNNPLTYQNIQIGTQAQASVKINTTEARTSNLRWNFGKGLTYDIEFDFMIEESNVMTSFEPYYILNSSVIKNNSISYQNLNQDLQTLIDNKLQMEQSEGDLVLTDGQDVRHAAYYQCTKIGNVVNISITASCAGSQNEVSFMGLPYESVSTVRLSTYSSSDLPVKATIIGNWINFKLMQSDENGNQTLFPIDDTVDIHMTYLTP